MIKIKAVLFDQDGVILDSESTNKKSVNAIFKKYNITREGGDRRFKGMSIRKIFEETFSPELKIRIDEILKERREIFKKLAKKEIRVFDGFFELINILKNKYKLALVTSASKETLDFNKKNLLNKEDIFDLEITSDDFKKSKPNPEPYIVAAKKLNLKPEECLVIEDSINGLISAKSAGMKVIAITNSFKKEELEKVNPDKVIFSLRDITLDLIDKIERSN